MLRRRVIPVLLLNGRGGLVKTQRFKNPRYVGDPINAVKIFNEKEVDELVLLDIDATRDGREPNVELVRDIVSEAFMPIGYGGGVRTLKQAEALVASGVEKVLVNSAAFSDLGLLGQLRDAFGASSTVAVVDVRRSFPGAPPRVHSWAGRSVPELDPLRWARTLVAAGAGEIVLQSVNRDGTMGGYDLPLLEQFHHALEVPLVAAGGAGSFEDMQAAFEVGDLSGVAAGAQFVYQGPHRAVLITYLSPHELKQLQPANS